MEKEVSLIGHEPTYAQRCRVHSYHVRLHTHRGGHMRKGDMNLNLGQTHRVQVTIWVEHRQSNMKFITCVSTRCLTLYLSLFANPSLKSITRICRQCLRIMFLKITISFFIFFSLKSHILSYKILRN